MADTDTHVLNEYMQRLAAATHEAIALKAAHTQVTQELLDLRQHLAAIQEENGDLRRQLDEVIDQRNKLARAANITDDRELAKIEVLP
jgi:predicted  nucleic acid-binding Zn-ribbon protein